ncbi:nucleotidyl transferase AbiEii/AbiGii toxin family protein [Litorihabitans aurantiacus]|uniref:nucleotidyl transferase AbiEii/AbiGii toxin family protein n=1 Tax=Litorihabitans aurantiacus TaxID=1930061 RepID=UPI003D66B698
MHLEHQIAQKLHAVTDPAYERAHDLVDLQLLWRADPDLPRLRDLCERTFDWRRRQPWPPLPLHSTTSWTPPTTPRGGRPPSTATSSCYPTSRQRGTGSNGRSASSPRRPRRSTPRWGTRRRDRKRNLRSPFACLRSRVISEDARIPTT